MRICLLVLFAIIFTISLTQAYGHKPIQSDDKNTSFERALIIPDHKISWVIYEDLDSFESKYYFFSATKGDSFYSSIVIPKLVPLENYKPSLSLAVVESKPNLTEDNEPIIESISEYNYDGMIPSEEFYEPFGQVTYWERQEIKITIPQTGDYYLIVSDKQGISGKYGLAVGTIEDFSPSDFVTVLPAAWFQTKLFFGDYVSASVPFIILGLVPIVIISIKRKMKLKSLTR